MSEDRDYDVIVVGGGPAGVSVAYGLAKLGKSVIILDKKSHDQIGNKACGDALDKSSPEMLFEEFGLPMPDGDEVSDTLTKLSVRTPSTTVTLAAPGYTVDRHIYGQRLLKNCEEIGVVVIDRASVREVLIEDGYVVGVGYTDANKKEKVELRAPLVADCSGTFGAVRQKLPEGFSEGVHPRIPDHHLAATYREIVDMTEDHPYPAEIVLSYAPSIPPPGYIWFFSKGDKKLNIGTGWLKSENYGFERSMKEIYRDALDEIYREGEDYDIKIRGGGQIPIRPPFDSLVFNGGMLIGDAGCLVDPTTAEGHGIALVAGMYAAKVMADALDRGDYSRESLWKYNTDVMAHYGRRNSISYVTLQYLRDIEASGMDIVLKKKLLTEDEIKAVFNGRNPKMGVVDILTKVVRSFPNFGILWKLYKLASDIGTIGEIYDNYPNTPDDLSAWIKRRNDFLGEDL
ncbi:MAG: NAD(P)/FAD-dependent oxidoreductase [Candidatus Kariarchaeaceae archaeon]|jgi:geranylgeranyl reductase family protein